MAGGTREALDMVDAGTGAEYQLTGRDALTTAGALTCRTEHPAAQQTKQPTLKSSTDTNLLLGKGSP